MMKSDNFIIWVVLTQILIFFPITSSYAQTYTTYAGLRIVSPIGEANDDYNGGWGVTGTSQFKFIPKIDLLFEGSWYNLSGKKVEIPGQKSYQVEHLSVLCIAVGAGYNLGLFQIGFKGGYFFDDLHEWDLVPYAQVNFWRLILGVDYKGLLGSENVQSLAIYLSYRWW